MGRRLRVTPEVGEHHGYMRARWTAGARGETGQRCELYLGPVDQPDVWRAALARLMAELAADPAATGRPAG